ncbi:MAG TPA: hypothetical protein VK791_10180 [bacterium]|nr:hypothetical protein [bacterium]
MNTNQINYLNIGLMFLSAVLGFAWPFETFLFVYTVLGPLHYLTEISWLHERNYYTKGRFDYLYLVGATAVLTIANQKIIPGLPEFIPEWAAFSALGAALAFVVFKTAARWVLAVVFALIGFFIASASWFGIAFGVFLPTLIHVFIFTACFVLAGALKGRSLTGYLSLGVFALVSLSFVFIHPAHASYVVSQYTSNNYGTFQSEGNLSSPFMAVNYYFAKIVHLAGFNLPAVSIAGDASYLNDYLYHNPAALALMSFIAFAYSYHYFNWFSKTSIIRWHEVSKGRLAVIVAIWLISVGLYLYNYSVGLRWLFFLSLAHVLLEFPLNQLTFIQIGKELKGRIVRSPERQ